jgi:hypothetical protein
MTDLLRLRTHHLIDIVTDYGRGAVFAPHPYGHAVHTVAERVIEEHTDRNAGQEGTDK